MTAKHVVDAAGGRTLNVACAFPDVDTDEVHARAGFLGITATVVDVMSELDLALLTAPLGRLGPIEVLGREVPLYRTPARLSTARVKEGMAIAVSGYPLDEPSLVTTAGSLASSFSIMEHEKGQHKECYLGDCTANPGNSGGPVYTVKDASVIGVCVAGRMVQVIGGEGLHAAAGLTIIVPVENVIALLDRNNVAANQEESRQGDGHTQSRRRRRRRR